MSPSSRASDAIRNPRSRVPRHGPLARGVCSTRTRHLTLSAKGQKSHSRSLILRCGLAPTRPWTPPCTSIAAIESLGWSIRYQSVPSRPCHEPTGRRRLVVWAAHAKGRGEQLRERELRPVSLGCCQAWMGVGVLVCASISKWTGGKENGSGGVTVHVIVVN